jgi:hypothetical protein
VKALAKVGCPPSYLERYIAIRERKHLKVRNKLAAAHAFVEERFDELTSASNTKGFCDVKMDPRRHVIADELRACYDGSTSPLRDLKAAIKRAQPSRAMKYCPMCGTTLHTAFDRYMPMVRFPEFSVHPLNLVPCCSKCNSIKHDDWLTTNGERQYLHSYSDDFSNKSFLFVTLVENSHLTGVGAAFSLARPIGVGATHWRLIKSHFERLHLLERYGELSNDEISEIIADCRVLLDCGGVDPRAFLNGQAGDLSGVYGASHWRAVLMSELANHAKLDSWIGAML